MKSVLAFGLFAIVGFALLSDVTDAHECKGKECGKPPPPKPPKKLPHTCLDLLRAGKRRCGVYRVYDAAGKNYPVYCDMKSEPGNAWTLVMSYSLQHKGFFNRKGFQINYPVNENSPNWNLYRLTKVRMNTIRAHSTHWRSTCSFPKAGIDYRDYVRGNFKDFNIMTFRAAGACRKVEQINVRGHYGFHLTTRWWQHPTSYALHLDSSLQKPCQFHSPKAGSVPSEDNFGYYHSFNKKFRCTENAQSTTQYWFGGHL